MNAAEITDKLGLHSLRQRAWVCLRTFKNGSKLSNSEHSTSNPLAPHLVMAYMKVSNGLATRSERSVTPSLQLQKLGRVHEQAGWPRGRLDHIWQDENKCHGIAAPITSNPPSLISPHVSCEQQIHWWEALRAQSYGVLRRCGVLAGGLLGQRKGALLIVTILCATGMTNSVLLFLPLLPKLVPVALLFLCGISWPQNCPVS